MQKANAMRLINFFIMGVIQIYACSFSEWFLLTIPITAIIVALIDEKIIKKKSWKNSI